MRYFKIALSITMLWSTFHALRGWYLFYNLPEYHQPATAQLIGSLALTAFACLIMLITIWNYQQMLKEEN